MVEHCHLEFTENPYQQYPKPPIKFNFDEAAIIDGEIQQLLEKRVLEETGLWSVCLYHIPQEEEKWFLQINLESKRTECIHRVSTFQNGKLDMCYSVHEEKLLHGLYRLNRCILHFS